MQPSPPKSDGGPHPPHERTPSQTRSIEILLDPRSLQALMICGGSLLVLGLVVWLWSIGVFANPYVVAACLGAANLGLLGVGSWLVVNTRYQTAGRAITLLACLVMPLNLWLYDAQGLITLTDGGHLWVPALVICLLYAVVARLIKDPMFVYTLVAGVVLTGLLILADHRVDRLWEVMGPSTLLVVLGMAFIHAERLFPVGNGPFTRDNFGRAFFRSGHIVMAVGLVVLLAGRLVGWLYEPWLAEYGWFARPEVATVAAVKFTALLLAIGAAYTYVYSQVVAPRGARYAVSALLTLLWCEVILLDLLPIPFTEELLVLVLASTALAANAGRLFARQSATGNERDSATIALEPLTQSFSVLGTTCAIVAAAIVGGQYMRGLLLPADTLLAFELTWAYVVAAAATAVACLVSAHAQLPIGRSHSALSQAGALATVFATAGLLQVVGVTSLTSGLPILVLLPVAMQIRSLTSHSQIAKSRWSHCAEVTTTLLLVLSVFAVAGDRVVAMATLGAHEPLLLATFYALAAYVYGSVAATSARHTTIFLAVTTGAAAMWQLLLYADFVRYAPILAASATGLGCLLVARSSLLRMADMASRRFEIAGQLAMMIASAAGGLLALNRLAGGGANISLAALMLAQCFVAGVAARLSTTGGERRCQQIIAAAHLLAGLFVVNAISGLSILQRFEVVLAVGGGLMLVAGHVGWRKEGDRTDESVSFNLGAGSLLATVPLLCGLLAIRVFGESNGWAWVLLHEVGVLVVGLALLGSGVLCRIRVTTVAGAAALLAYIGSLITMIHVPDQLQNVAVYLMVGGGTFFGVAVLLSVYRDRLLDLPQQFRKGEGIFQVRTWR